MAEPLNILVTGATGLVGAEVTARLAREGHAVTALVHRNRELLRNNGRPLHTLRYAEPPVPGAVRLLDGDVTEAGLGLPRALREALAPGLDRIVHCAAVTDFGRPPEVYESVNVRGTEHVIALARAAGTPLVHVGTAYVCGEREGTALEAELDVGQRFANDYEDSKFRAETLVRKAQADGLPVAVVRPSVVVGAERSGVVRDYKNIYVVLKLATEGRVRAVPGRNDAVLDLVPVDYAADVVSDVAVRFDRAEGGTFHAVGSRLTLRDFSDVLAEYPSFHVPRFVPPSSFDTDRLPRRERVYHLRVISLYESYFRRRVRFDDSATRSLGVRTSPRQGLPFLRRLINHCLEIGFLGAAPAPVAGPAAGPDTDRSSSTAGAPGPAGEPDGASR